jgi:hypothetical protein
MWPADWEESEDLFTNPKSEFCFNRRMNISMFDLLDYKLYF